MAEQKDQKGLNKVKQLIELMKDHDLVEVEIIEGDNKIHLKRPQPAVVNQVPVMPQPAVMPAAPVPGPQASDQSAPAEDQGLIEVKSPIVGTFYSSPSPDSDAYVKVNDRVEADTVVCIVEAMKVMNEIKAEASGTIVKIMCKAGEAVEYGQVLFKVKPD